MKIKSDLFVSNDNYLVTISSPRIEAWLYLLRYPFVEMTEEMPMGWYYDNLSHDSHLINDVTYCPSFGSIIGRLYSVYTLALFRAILAMF